MRATLVGIFVAVGVLAGGAPAPAQTRTSPVDQIIARCPTAAEVASIQVRTPVTFDASVLGGALVCTAAAGSVDLNAVQMRTFQSLVVPPAEANFGAIGCRLGSLAVGTSTKVTIKFKVTARAGTVLRNATRETQGFLPGAVAISEEREPRADRARANHIVALQTTVKAKPKPKKKKKPRR